MFFDLTKNIPLDKNGRKNYAFFRALLFLGALAAFLYLSYLILFPKKDFAFSLLNPNSSKNNSMSVRDKDNEFPTNGKLEAQKNLIFDASLVGNFSNAKITFTAGNKFIDLSGENVVLRKSFQAFFYPEGEALGFRDGSLLKSKNNFYIISDQKLRKFSDKNTLLSLGFNPQAFIEASPEELSYTNPGEEIKPTDSYPNYSLFKVDNTFYQLQNGTLRKFVSPQAYTTQYQDHQAISKEKSFLDNFSLSPDLLGFADGSLISYGESVFIVSEGKVLPIDNPVTFEKMGYVWEDIIPVSGDELYLYQKDKLFNITRSHPEGTVFKIAEENQFYLIKNQQKHLLPSEKIALSYFKKTPIAVSKKSLTEKQSCLLEKSSGQKEYICTIPLDKFSDILGKDYQFELENKEETEIDALGVVFSKKINRENFRLAISDIISKIKINYAIKN